MEILANNTILAYADYFVIIGNTRHEVVVDIDDLLNVAKPINLKANQKKTKYIMVTR